MANRRALRRDWFEIGKAALRTHSPEAPGYGCPLCLLAAPVVDPFTVEDVPPASVGGKPLVLTCRDCNSVAGHKLDVHVAKGQLIRSFARGENIRPTKHFRLRIDDTVVPMRLASSEEGIQLIGHERAGSPDSRNTITDHFQEAVESARTDWELHLEFPSFSQRKEQLGWLRAAYLVCFAKLGYAYILRPELRVVIQQLQQVESELITDYVVWNVATPSSERHLALIERPDMQCLAVSMGQATVFLPSIAGDNDIYNQLPLLKQRGPIQVSGKEISWPVGPEFLLDRVPPRD